MQKLFKEFSEYSVMLFKFNVCICFHQLENYVSIDLFFKQNWITVMRLFLINTYYNYIKQNFCDHVMNNWCISFEKLNVTSLKLEEKIK